MGMEIARELYTLGMSFLELGRTRAACLQFEKAIDIAPNYTDAVLALGHCFHIQGKYDQALAIYDKLLTASPLLFAAWSNRGNSLLEMCRYEEAAASYLRALEIFPGVHNTRVALATCYQALGRAEEALAACKTVLASDPENAEAHWNHSLLLLLNGEYQEGWQEYEWRWKKQNFTSPIRNFPQPLWQGENPDGRTILVHAEQGFGDTLQFSRYVPLVAALGAHIIFECHPPLAELMKSLVGNIDVVRMGEKSPPFDLHVPLLGLPLIFKTDLDTIPASVPYLAAPADRLLWRHLVPDESRMKIGLCWAGKEYPDPRRSCPAALLAPLQGIEGISWYSLQVGWKKILPLPMKDLTCHIHDFSDTAALISRLDLVITIDTSVAHVAGALGKPVYLMLPYAADWRWLINRDDSPWYPTVKIFRQSNQNSWQDVVHRVACCLSKAN